MTDDAEEDYGSLIRNNLMRREGYTPYCGNNRCTKIDRTVFKNGQFHATCCNWVSTLDEEFIKLYKAKWNLS